MPLVPIKESHNSPPDLDRNHRYQYNITINNNHLSTIYYLEGLVDLEKIGEIIIKKYELNQKLILFPNVKEEKDYNAVIQKIIDGNVVVFDYTENRIYSVELRRLYLRSVAEPDNEKIIKGPREGLIENIITNVSLIRNKIRRKDLKVEYKALNDGEYKIGILYLKKTVNLKSLRILKQRINKIKKIKSFDINYIKEQIKDRKYSPFNTVGDTQRPDVCAFELLKGKIIVLIDGSPTVIYLPYLSSNSLLKDLISSLVLYNKLFKSLIS